MNLPRITTVKIPKLLREDAKWAILLAGLAFIVSILFVFLVAQPTIHVLDGAGYHNIAFRLLQESRYGPIGYPYPIYPLFLAAIYYFGGDYHTVFIAQGFVLALVAGLSYGLARVIAGHSAGVFAALLVTLDISLLGNVGLIVTENLQTLLLLLAMLASLYAIERSEARYHGLAGVLWGLLTLVKPVTLVWPIALLPVYFIISRRRSWLICWGLVALGFALTLSPWLVRNQLSDDIAPIGPRSSFLLMHVLDEGESRHTLTNMAPKIEAALAEAEERGIEAGSLQFQLYTLSLLKERIERSPADYLAFVWDTFSRFWVEPSAIWLYSVYEGDMHLPGGYRDVPGYSNYAKLHILLTAMGLVSLLLLFRTRPRAALLVFAFLLYYAVLYTMTHFIPRYSAPVAPLVLIGAAVFPALVMEFIKDYVTKFRYLSNVLMAATAVALISGVSLHAWLQGPNVVQDGSFETEEVDEEWSYEWRIGEPKVPLVIDPHRAHDGFRAAGMEIDEDDQAGDARLSQHVPVWFEGTYRLKFSYLILEAEVGTPLYVEVGEMYMFREGWGRVLKEYQPTVTNRWIEREYEFQVSSTTHTVSIILGLWDTPSRVLIDNVRLERATPVGELIARPYLLRDPEGENTSVYLPLDKWVLTQPEANREFLSTNLGVARANGWKGGRQDTLEQTAYRIGAVVLLAWAVLSLLFIRLRVVEKAYHAKLFEYGLTALMVALILVQAATCYLLLFSNPV
jgi:hypothetical protein